VVLKLSKRAKTKHGTKCRIPQSLTTDRFKKNAHCRAFFEKVIKGRGFEKRSPKTVLLKDYPGKQSIKTALRAVFSNYWE